MNFLKRADIILFVWCLAILFTACSVGTMGEKSRGESDYTGNLDLTSLKYLDQIYSDESGKKFYQKSLAGSLFLSEDNAVQLGVSESLNMDFFEKIDTLKGHSGKYWEDRDFDLSRLSKKLESEDSGEVFNSYIEESSGSSGGKSVIKKSVMLANQAGSILQSASILTELASLSAFAGIYNAYEGYDKSEYINDLNMTFRKILTKLNEIDKRNSQIKDDLRNIEKNINSFQDDLYNMSVQLYGEDLKKAENRMNGFLLEISAIEGGENREQLSMIKDFILHGYEEMFIGAFRSALNVNSYINSTLPSDKKIPLSMSLSDMSFMLELSFLRLSLAPFIFKGEELLNYRANIAKTDIARVRLLKRTFSRAYDRIGNTEYRDTAMTLIAAWEIILMAHIEVVQDIDDAVIIEMEGADNYLLGYGTFGDEDNYYGHVLTKNDSVFLVDASNIKYGDVLSEIFDTGISGYFSTGKYLRIVENGRNVADPSGLGLTPVCMNFSGGVFAPPKDKVYIDPVTGQFVLPRPSYWSRMESLENITSPEIGEGKPYTEFSGTCTSETFPESKFGGGYCLYNYDISIDGAIQSHIGNRKIYPFGKNSLKDFNKGAISLWFNFDISYNTSLISSFSNNAITKISISEEYLNLFGLELISGDYGSRYASLTINGMFVKSAVIDTGGWTHIYVIWDSNKNLIEGKTVRIFINGIEKISIISDIPDLALFSMMINLHGETIAQRPTGHISSSGPYSSYSYTQIDNIQIWNDVVTEDPNIFYNNGNGREDALHSIYGPENGYKPSNVGVGYHYVQ